MISVQAEPSSARLSTELNTVLSNALNARECGCSVIPLKGGRNRVTGKQPRISWQVFQKQFASTGQIEEWFRGGTSAYGIVCGQVSRLIVIDFDERDAQMKFMQKFPHLMDTYIVKSGGRGTLHFYFEADFPVKTTKIRGGDLKAEGSYVVGAGSQIEGGRWEVFNDVQLKRISQQDLDNVMSVFGITRPVGPQPSIETIPKTDSLNYFTSIYASFVQQFQSRNEALFRVGCMMRDESYDFDTVKAVLSQAHVQHPPVNRHKPETTFQRHRETHLTLRSVFKRPARPKSNRTGVKAHASYVPNHLREVILKHKHGTAFLRVYEGLKLVGNEAGGRVTERDIHTLLAPHGIGRHSIRHALTFTSDPDIHTDTLAGAMGSKMPKGVTNTCVFVPATKSNKSRAHRPPQEYVIPTIGRLLDLFKIKSKGADPITLDDIESVKTYRSALNRELIRRRAGKYSQAWLAKRLSVCVRTLQRYIKLDGIQSQQILYTTDITPDNIHQIPPKSLARRAGITIQYCFLQDATGKRYPPIQAIARKLLRQGITVQWMRRGWNFYWIGEKATQSHVVLVPEIEHMFDS